MSYHREHRDGANRSMQITGENRRKCLSSPKEFRPRTKPDHAGQTALAGRGFGTDFWHAVEFSRNGRTPVRAFRPFLGQPTYFTDRDGEVNSLAPSALPSYTDRGCGWNSGRPPGPAVSRPVSRGALRTIGNRGDAVKAGVGRVAVRFAPPRFCRQPGRNGRAGREQPGSVPPPAGYAPTGTPDGGRAVPGVHRAGSWWADARHVGGDGDLARGAVGAHAASSGWVHQRLRTTCTHRDGATRSLTDPARTTTRLTAGAVARRRPAVPRPTTVAGSGLARPQTRVTSAGRVGLGG